MLNFEDEMKAVRKGYVVLDIDEYNRMRDEIAAANMKAYEVEQSANRRLAEADAKHQATIDNLICVRKRTYGEREIDIVFNAHAIRKLAIVMLHEMFSDEELDGYTTKSADDMCILDEVLAYKADTDESTDNVE